jgi:hypothetical protein
MRWSGLVIMRIRGEGLRRAILMALLVPASLAWAGETVPAGLYEVTVETSMPHLEENLRYAVTHETRYLDHQDLALAFPILGHASLSDCHLDGGQRSGEEVFYALICTGAHGTTGNAVWTLDAQRISGTLHVKLGGKNMTFSQRWTAVPARNERAPHSGSESAAARH